MREYISSRKNPLIGLVRNLQASARARREAGCFLLDGPTLLIEALTCGGQVELVLTVAGTVLPDLPAAVRVVEIPDDVMTSIAPTNTPQGVLAVCRLPELALPEQLNGQRYLILDSVQDPGNVGAILRSCAAFSADGLILSGNCADPFGPKAVRASMGAIFRCPIYSGETAEIRSALGDTMVFRADLTAGAVDIRRADMRRAAFVIGSEGRGVSEIWRSCTDAVVIPMARDCESLNVAVATSVVLWEMARRDADGGK